MKSRLLSYCLVLLFLACFTGCEEKEGTFTPQPYKVVGTVEKGPFVRGSKITAQALDASFNLTGDVYQGIILDHDGSFDLGDIVLDSPYVLLSADGYYFNEVSGELSKGQISMQSLVNLSGDRKANVNVFTHLKAQRMLQLLRNGARSFGEVERQVQKEVLKSFGFERYADKSVSDFSIASGTDEAGALIVVSASLLYGLTDAQLTESLAVLSAEFKANGSLREQTWKSFREICMKLDLTKIEMNIINRYKELGVDITVPDLNYAIDWDNDGIAGNEPDAGDDYSLSLEKDTLIAPAGGGTFRVKINCKAPVTLQKPDGALEEEDVLGLEVFKTDDIKFAPAIEGKELVITVSPSTGALMSGKNISVYSTNGKFKVKLKLLQEGDRNKPVELGQYGKQMVTAIALKMRDASQIYSNLDGYYTQCFNGERTAFSDFYRHRISSYTSMLNTIWERTYNPITYINQIRLLVEQQGISIGTEEFNHHLNQLAAMLYFQAASWWGSVVWTEDNGNPASFIRQLGSAELFEMFTDDILYCVDRRPSGGTDIDSFDGFFYPSRETSLALLAKMNLHRKAYAPAYEYLKRIIDGGVFRLDMSAAASLRKGSKELIYGFILEEGQNPSQQNVLQGNDYIPFMTYTEVILSAAECAYRLGRQAEAMDYLNQVVWARNLPLLSPETDYMESLRAVWESELKGFGSYFAFLRRNDLAVGKLKIQFYQQWMPIPESVVRQFPQIAQNPGW